MGEKNYKFAFNLTLSKVYVIEYTLYFLKLLFITFGYSDSEVCSKQSTFRYFIFSFPL